MSSKLAEWIGTINEKLGTEFELDASGQLLLEFEGGRRIAVELPDGAPQYVIYTPIGLLNCPAELPRLFTALQLNLYQHATAGGVIALDVATGSFMYSFTYPTAHSSAEMLAHQLDQFVEHADRLQRELEQATLADGGLDFELDAMKQELGLLTDAEAEEIESQAVLDEPAQVNSDMIRV